MTAALAPRLLPALLLTALAAASSVAASSEPLRVVFEPARPRSGDVVLMQVRGATRMAIVEADVDGHPVNLFPTATGYAGVFGLDMDDPPGARPWRVTARVGETATATQGALTVTSRSYSVQHLTVAPSMAELDPETERRANEETARLRLIYRTVTGERLWRGSFVRPVAGDEPGTGFGARRVINGRPRSPHSGVDFPAAVGSVVSAANRGRVVLTGEFYFPGRLVILDHGLGLHTAYFHLHTIAVAEGQIVARGEALGTVGMTGRVTGPHLHFGAQVGAARIDPTSLFGLGTEAGPP